MEMTKHYREFEPTNPIFRKMMELENPVFAKAVLPYVTYEPNHCVLPQGFRNYYEQVKEFPVDNSDIWIDSFPKSGSQWTQEMIWLVKNNYDLETAKKPIDKRIPFLEESMFFMGQCNTWRQESSFNFAQQMTDRILKTHLPYNLLPAKIQNGEKIPKIIYIARHPRDVVVSYHHHRVLFTGYKGTLEDTVEQFTADMTLLSPYWTHVREFWERRNNPNILFLKYEDMSESLADVIHRVANFLDVPAPNEAQLKAVLKHLSFDVMKANPYVNNEKVTEELIKKHGLERKTNYIRKGKVGGWKEELSPASKQLLDHWIDQNCIDGLYE